MSFQPPSGDAFARRFAAGFLISVLPLFSQMTMEQAISMSMEKNRELLALRQRIPEAAGARLQAGLRPNPTLDVSLGNGAIVRNNGYWDGAVGYSQLIELGKKRDRRLEVAASDFKVVEFEIRERERMLRASVQSAYVEALAASRNLQTAEELLKLTEQSANVVSARVQQGEAPALDRSLLDVELGRVRADLILFANQRSRALSAIRTLTGMAPQAPLSLESKLELSPSAIVIAAEAVQHALSNRTDIQILRQLESSGEASIRLEKSMAVPNLTASARFSYAYDFIQRITISPGISVPITDRDPILTVGLTIDLPWRNKNQGNIETAIARRQNVKLRREYQEQLVSQEVSTAIERWDAARSSVQLFERQVLEQSRANLTVIRGVYELGEIRLLDFINEQRKLNDAQRTYTELLKERYLSVVELERATGVEVLKGKP